MLGLLGFVTLSYVYYLKTSFVTKDVYVKAKVLSAKEEETVPYFLVDSLNKMKVDDTKKVEILKMKYFIFDPKEWMINDNLANLSVFLKIKAEERGKKMFFDGQELSIGYPLHLSLSQRKIDLRIEDVSGSEIQEDYKKINIKVKLWAKQKELIAFLQKGVELKDNNGFTYATITQIDKTPAVSSVGNSSGQLVMAVDPLSFDLILHIQTLAKVYNDRIEGYDGKLITTGARFVFNHPLLYKLDGYVIDVQ